MSVNIIIRTDASNMIGTGHVMRCLTLAEQLMKANAQTKITVISRDLPGNLSELIKSKGFDVKLLGLITVPKFIETNSVMYPTFVQFHYQSMIALVVVFGIHLSAGLYHRFMKSDTYGVLNRMSFWGKD